MAVSCTKAMLVVMFFMHLLWEANWKYVLTIPAAFMSVFLVAMLVPDVGMRLFRYSEERMIHAAKVAPYESHQAASHEAAEHANGEGHGTGHGGSQPDHHAPGDAHDGSTH